MSSIPPELLEQQGIHPNAPPTADEAGGPYEQPHHHSGDPADAEDLESGERDCSIGCPLSTAAT